MDQSAFRDLLATAPPKAGTGRAAGVLGGQSLKRGYGIGSGRPKDFKPKEKSEPSKPEFAPRKVKKDGKYKDRAEMRRLGLEDEFKPIERMVDEFEERAKAEGEDEEAIAAKRAYLGGDAEHSALFKGLDYGLLEARKAELAAQEGSKYDDELDKVLESGLAEDDGHESAVAGPGPSTTGQKKSREDILNALQESRKRLAGPDEPRSEKKKKVKVDVPPAMPEGLGSRFKKIITANPGVSEAGGKKKKKKKQVMSAATASALMPPPPPPPRQPGLTITSDKADMPPPPPLVDPKEAYRPMRSPTPPDADDWRSRPAEKVEDHLSAPPAPSPLPVSNASSLSTGPVSPAQPSKAIQLDSEDEDIFGGVGDYEMDLGSESDDDEAEEKLSKEPSMFETRANPGAVIGKKGKGWFGDEEEDEESAPADSMLPSILRTTRLPTSAPGESSQRLSSRSPSPEDGPMRPLQPLSSSKLPSAKELLAMDKAAEADEKRREKKAKWRAKQGLAAQDGNDEDDEDRGRGKTEKDKESEEKRKQHREAQQLEAFMAKKTQA